MSHTRRSCTGRLSPDETVAFAFQAFVQGPQCSCSRADPCSKVGFVYPCPCKITSFSEKTHTDWSRCDPRRAAAVCLLFVPLSIKNERCILTRIVCRTYRMRSCCSLGMFPDGRAAFAFQAFVQGPRCSCSRADPCSEVEFVYPYPCNSPPFIVHLQTPKLSAQSPTCRSHR